MVGLFGASGDSWLLMEMVHDNVPPSNIRSLPSIDAEKNVTKNEHICSMCIKTNKVGKQEVGI
jgi:hypothetical protein